MLLKMVPIDREALEFIIRPGKGPYLGKWHKQNHSGPLDCAGCAMEQALQAKEELASTPGP